MCNARTPILVGVVSSVSETWLHFACLQKQPKFPIGPLHNLSIEEINLNGLSYLT